MVRFDVFEIRAYREGYMLQVNAMRPRNASSTHHTKADFKRRAAVAEENLKLAKEPLLPDLAAVMERIKEYDG